MCSIGGTGRRRDAQVGGSCAGAEEFTENRKMAEDRAAGGEREGCMWEGRGEDGGKEEREDENGEHCTTLLVLGVIYLVPEVTYLVPGGYKPLFFRN